MNLRISTPLVLFFLLLNNYLLAQPIEATSISITDVKVGTLPVDRAEWKTLSLSIDVPLTIDFELSAKINEEVSYKVFLDGNIFSTKQKEKRVLLNQLNAGTHILKIVPVNNLEVEGVPLLLSFLVTDGTNIGTKKTDVVNPSVLTIHPSDYILGGLIFLQFVIIMFLIISRKKTNVASTSTKGKIRFDDADNQQEIISLKRKVDGLKDDLQIHQQANELLRNQLHELNTNVQDLERANLHLIEQKEKLEKSKYKLELLHSQKEEMFAMAIHDIKNPASAIRGYIDLLNSFDLNAIEQQEIMVSLVSTSEDIVKMSQDMCSILAKAMPEPSLNFTKHQIGGIIETVVNQNLSYSKTKKVKLTKKIASHMPEINIDAEKIEEALDNLINNAIKFAPPETIIEISTYLKEEKKKTIVVQVKDNGVGLSEEDLRRSFQKGATLSAKPTGLEQSSGLGLWIVKKIVEEHGGNVWVESKLGIGSTFAFELPVE